MFTLASKFRHFMTQVKSSISKALPSPVLPQRDRFGGTGDFLILSISLILIFGCSAHQEVVPSISPFVQQQSSKLYLCRKRVSYLLVEKLLIHIGNRKWERKDEGNYTGAGSDQLMEKIKEAAGPQEEDGPFSYLFDDHAITESKDRYRR